jgi:C4-dicarboxylate-specific signal transduction histidine kinase
MKITLYIIIALAVIVALCVLIIIAMRKKLKAAQITASQCRAAYQQVSKRAEELANANAALEKATEEANAQKQSLRDTPDAALADRANALFGGGGSGDADGVRNGQSAD